MHFDILDTTRIDSFMPYIPAVNLINLFGNDGVRDSTISAIATHIPSLARLYIDGCTNLTSACLPDLKRLKRLRILFLTSEFVDDMEALSLVCALPILECIRLENASVTNCLVYWLVTEFKLQEEGNPASRFPSFLCHVALSDCPGMIEECRSSIVLIHLTLPYASCQILSALIFLTYMGI